MNLYNVYDIHTAARIGEKLTAAQVRELCGLDTSHICNHAKNGRIFQHRYRFEIIENVKVREKKDPDLAWRETWSKQWDKTRMELKGIE